MKAFNYFQPTEIRFGSGRIAEIAEVVGRFGKRCLLVTTPPVGKLADIYGRVINLLKDGGIEVAHFDGVVPNPTTDCITAGSKMAQDFDAQVVLGLGGGSSMDTAKAIAVECTHKGPAWDYRWCSETQPTEQTLPIVAVTTTSGTGSEVTQVAVLTNTARKDKSAIYNSIIYPKVAVVDPELTVTVPPSITAQTGFDVFTHAFESYLHPSASPYTDRLALEAIRLVTENLPTAVKDGNNLRAREGMAWANILAGLCIANAGVTLPHGIGMTIGGYCPQVSHGQALAIVYPEFTRYTYPYAVAQFATMGRIFDPPLENETDEIAAEKSCQVLDAFLKEIDLWLSLERLGVTKEEVVLIADHSQVLPDYQNNPRVATRDEIYEILMNSYQRE
jgi:alcohol dehydrogenase class IV